MRRSPLILCFWQRIFKEALKWKLRSLFVFVCKILAIRVPCLSYEHLHVFGLMEHCLNYFLWFSNIFDSFRFEFALQKEQISEMINFEVLVDLWSKLFR